MFRDAVFAALASPIRREMLDLLRTRAQAVHELAEHFQMRRPSVSEHLKVLREAGLVVDERVGRQRIYRVEPEPLREVVDWLYPYEAFWRERLGGLRRLLDEEEAHGRSDDDRSR